MDVFCVCIAEFDLLKGNTLSHVYPPERSTILNSFTSHLGDYCLPDGAHYFEEDATYLVIPSNVVSTSLYSFLRSSAASTTNTTSTSSTTNSDTDMNVNSGSSGGGGGGSIIGNTQQIMEFIEPYVDKPMYAHCLFRNKKDARVKRGAIQKSIILFSSKPLFTVYENLLRLTLNRILDLENIHLQVNATATKKQPGQEELNETDLNLLKQVNDQIFDTLKEFYNECRNCNMLQLKLFPNLDTITLNIPRQIDPFTPIAFTHGTSLLQIVQYFGLDAMLVCWNALLLDKRIMVIGSPAKLVSQICLTLPLLIYPFQYNVNRVHPYVPLSEMDEVLSATSKVPEYIIGTTNALFETQGKNQRTQWWDVCLSINSSTRKVQLAEKMPPHFGGSDLSFLNSNTDSPEDVQIDKLNAYQKVFMLNVINGVVREGKSEQWVRDQFKTHNLKFITELLTKGKLTDVVENVPSDVGVDPQRQHSLLSKSISGGGGQLKKIQKQFISESSKFRTYAFKQYSTFRSFHCIGGSVDKSAGVGAGAGGEDKQSSAESVLQLLQYLQDDKIIKKQKLKYLFDLDKMLSNNIDQIDLLLSVSDNSSIFTTIKNNKWLIDDNNQWRKYSASILSQLAISVKGQIQLLSLLPSIKLLTEDSMPNVKRIGYYCIMKVSNLYIGTYAILRNHHDIIEKILDNILNESVTDANFYEIRMYSIQTLLQICHYFDYFKQSINVIMTKVNSNSNTNNNNMMIEDDDAYAKIVSVSVDNSMISSIVEKLEGFKTKITEIFSYESISNNSVAKRSLNDYKFIDKLLILYDYYEVYNNYHILTESALKYNMNVFYYLRNVEIHQQQNNSFTEMYHHITSIIMNIKNDLKKSSSLQQSSLDSEQTHINEFHHHHMSVYLLALLQSTNLVNIIFNEFILNVNHIKTYKNYKILYMVMQLLYYVIDTNVGMYYLLISNYIEYCLTFIKYFSILKSATTSSSSASGGGGGAGAGGDSNKSDSNNDSNLNFRLFKCYSFIAFLKRLCKYKKSACRLIESNALHILGQFIITHYYNPLLSNLTYAAIDLFQDLSVFYFTHYSKAESQCAATTQYFIEETSTTNNEKDDKEEEEQFFKNPLYERNSTLFFKKRIRDRLEMLPELRKKHLFNSLYKIASSKSGDQQDFEKNFQHESMLESSNFKYHFQHHPQQQKNGNSAVSPRGKTRLSKFKQSFTLQTSALESGDGDDFFEMNILDQKLKQCVHILNTFIFNSDNEMKLSSEE